MPTRKYTHFQFTYLLINELNKISLFFGLGGQYLSKICQLILCDLLPNVLRFSQALLQASWAFAWALTTASILRRDIFVCWGGLSFVCSTISIFRLVLCSTFHLLIALLGHFLKVILNAIRILCICFRMRFSLKKFRIKRIPAVGETTIGHDLTIWTRFWTNAFHLLLGGEVGDGFHCTGEWWRVTRSVSL